MELSGRIIRQILLFSMLVVTVPMVVFPERFGAGLTRASVLGAVIELAFYGVVTLIITRRGSLMRVISSAGICFVYRLALGVVFGLLVAGVYSIGVKAAVTLGLFGYLPAILLQAATVPFILRPALNRWETETPARQFADGTPTVPRREIGRTSIAVSKERGYRPPAAIREEPLSKTKPDVQPASPVPDSNGFDRATRYIGEHSTVLLVAVVDAEGLLLSRFTRGSNDFADWAPYALVLRDRNANVLGRLGWHSPDRLELLLKDRRLVVACENGFSLMVIAERQVDDVLSIRINQGLEIIRKYVAERYGRGPVANAERAYVSSAE